jgi:hypothetical protein
LASRPAWNLNKEVYVKRSNRGFICCAFFLALCAVPSWAQQTAPPAEQMPSEEPEQPAGPTKLPLPPAPKYPDVRMPGERGIMFGFSGWSTKADLSQLKGKASTSNNPGNIDFDSKRTLNRHAEFGVAVGAHNMLHVTYLQARGAGNGIAPTDLTLWTQAYSKGDYLATDYKLQSLKVSFDYLSWPYPVKSSRIRVRTLWSLQYTGIQTSFDAPLLPKEDTAGNAISYATNGREYFILPGVGIGVQGYVSRRFNLEANVSGFAIPHKQNYWDGDAAANVRIGHYELRAGVRAYHFRITPESSLPRAAQRNLKRTT